MIAWISLFFASVCETCWASSLKFLSVDKIRASAKENGWMSKPTLLRIFPFLTYAIFGILNMVLLTYSLKFIPLAICYAVWMGLALLIQTIIDVIVFKEKMTPKQIAFLICIFIGVVGLQTSTK